MHGPVREENDAQLLFEKLSFVWARAEVRWEMQKEEKKVIDLMKVTAADLVALFMKKLMVHIYVDKSWTLTRKNVVFTQSSGHIFFLAKISRRRLMGMNFSYIAN